MNAGTPLAGKRSRLWVHAGFLLLALSTALFLFLSAPVVHDPDELYHFRHAALYLERGPLLTEFPWAAHSVIRQEAADLWYGFHLLLAPFTLLPDAALGLDLAGAAILTALLVLLYSAAVRLETPWPAFWPFVLVLAAPPALLRVVVLRPHVLSLGLAAWFLVGLVRRDRTAALLSAAALAFFHLNLAWLILVVLVVVLVVRCFTERRFDKDLVAVSLAGLGVGWLLRPNPWGAAKLVYVQLVQWGLEKQSGTPLLVGGELLPVDPREFGAYFAPLLLLWLVAGVVFLRGALCGRLEIPASEKTFLGSTLILSVLFLEMTVLVALRASDQWKLFLVLFFMAAAGSAVAMARKAEGHPRAGHGAAIGVLLLLLLTIGRTLGPEREEWLRRGIPHDRLRNAAEWLERNSEPGEIVYHVQWESFAELFFWNQKNHYVNGMDPIFLFALNPARYWKAHHLATGRGAQFTCGRPDCDNAPIQETYAVLRGEFGARYLLLEPRRSPELTYAVSRDPRFQRRFAEGSVEIYELGDTSSRR